MRFWIGLSMLLAVTTGCGSSDEGGDTPGGTDAPRAVPEFGAAPTVAIVGSSDDGLDVPRDLAFHPDRPDELWIVNRGDYSMVIFSAAGTGAQDAEKRIDRDSSHFMAEPAAFAFGDTQDAVGDGMVSTFASCQESRNSYGGDVSDGDDFMGPVLWPGDLDLFAEVNQSNNLLGSHLDMLHQSPLCMGIAHAKGNQYWLFDGSNARLTWYDFETAHGYGEDDHSDGRVRRYEDVILDRVANVPSHIEVAADGTLFVADTGTGRVLWVDPAPASETGVLPFNFEPLDEFTTYAGATVEERVTGLDQPSGVLLVDDRLFISDHATGEVIAFDAATGEELARVDVGVGVMGLALGPDGRIWFVNGKTDELGQIVPG